jgi:hypothetical protein
MFYPQMAQMFADECRAAREGRRATGMSFMARDLPAVFREALELAEGDRASLAGLLIESLEQPHVPGRRSRRETGVPPSVGSKMCSGRSAYCSGRSAYRSSRSGYGSDRPGYCSNRTGYCSNRTGCCSNRTGYRSNRTGYCSRRTGYCADRSNFRSARTVCGSVVANFG